MSIYHTTAWGPASHFYQINRGNRIPFNYPEGEWWASDFSQDIELNRGENTMRITYNSGVTELQWIELTSIRP
jgi:hypothetical protein